MKRDVITTDRIKGGVLKNLLLNIVNQGDVATLLKVLPIFPILQKEERADPVEFWRYAFDLYFPEYIGVFDNFIGNDTYRWKKLSIWLTFAHRSIIQFLGARFMGRKPSSYIEKRDIFIGPLYITEKDERDETNMDTRTIIYKNNPISLRKWCRNVLGEPSGRLLTTAFKNVTNFIWEKEGDTSYTMETKALRSYIFRELNDAVWDLSIAKLWPKSRMTPLGRNHIMNTVFFDDNLVKIGTRFLVFARFICIGDVDTINNKLVDENVFINLPNVPGFDKYRGTVYMGKCIQCQDVATNIDLTTASLFCKKKSCVDAFYARRK